MNHKILTNSLALAIAALCLDACSPNASTKPAIAKDKDVEAQVELLLGKMSLEEKIGQMCEITIDVITDMSVADSFVLNEEALSKVIEKYKVGSILNVPKGVAQTPAVWSKLIRRLNQMSADAQSGVAQVYGVDQIHGASYTWGATLYPQEIGQAASFNRAIPFRVSEVAAYESRACLIPWVYSPVMDLGRNPLWSRMWESYGEDVYLNMEMARQAVRGYQGDDPNHIDGQHVAACIKHFMAYGVARTGKDRTPSSITMRELREKYFQPFRAAIEAGALSLMVNSGINDGLPFHANAELLTTWLKEELNWDGMIVTDWADINNLCTRDHIAATKKEAIEMAINAGIDMSMVPYEVEFCDLLHELVDEGRVKMARIDDAVRRVLRMKVRLGLNDKKTWDFMPEQLAAAFPKYGSMEFAEEATAFAEECIALLKNDTLAGKTERVLPLKEGTRLLVCGPNASNLRGQNGGWSYTWQGHLTNTLAPQMGDYKTFEAALRDRFSTANVRFVEGVRWSDSNFDRDEATDIAAAVAAARQADVVIACIGENSYCETVGNIDDLSLSPNQLQLVKALATTGKPIVLVLAEGRPRIIKEIEPLCAAVVHTFLPSNYGGPALARLLAGDANFSARMPYTYPKHPAALVTYDFKPCENMGQMEGNYNYDAVMDVQWPFGHGLSYTTFEYANLKVDKSDFTAADSLVFSVDVKNTGDRVGKEAVLLFSRDLVATLSPDNARLRAFNKIELKPGEQQTVRLAIAAKDLAFVGTDMRWRLEEGEFLITCGGQSLTIKCNETQVWDEPNI
ncbi:MAG: glycoside hydrolase family 3 C-terminal domain-containing protein [Bacteroidaceae bacterium]|nr:glycoside hydrolase family 3 C-terminal domain-containing protein [Bacteroidaceae bacterium]